jgi:formate dehydrogenase iron-sulfur subunit
MASDSRTLIDELLAEQGALSAVERFARVHAAKASTTTRYRELLPASAPAPGQQYAFEVDLDQCSGCKACVTACHSLNGLGDGETWRDVGQLVSHNEAKPFQQTVTTACHHCVDPGCLNGCPVLAYEKDPGTGIVHHLDDQCIGCQYCVLKCPYDVPKYSDRLGIVRKCDMCSQRLAVGEAPACVQACPNEAIAITLVSQEEVRVSRSSEGAAFLPASPDTRLTLPTTQYRSERGLPAGLRSTNFQEAQLQPGHWPLVMMLVGTQFGVGAWWAALATDEASAERLRWMSWVVGSIGLMSSIPHLGQPLKAWRSFLGWRKSWMSREILAFSVYMSVATIAIALPMLETSLLAISRLLNWTAGVSGLLAVICSGMLYHDTGRPTWLGWRSVGRFLLTSLLLGSASAMALAIGMGLPASEWFAPVALAGSGKLILESVCLWPARASGVEGGEESPEEVSARLQWTRLRALTWARLLGLTLGVVLLTGMEWAGVSKAAASFALGLLVASEVGERYSFFRTMVARRMPGV